MTRIIILPCNDSDALAEANRSTLLMDRSAARDLGKLAVSIIEHGDYYAGSTQVSIQDAVRKSVAGTVSIRPDDELPAPLASIPVEAFTVSVANETSLSAAKRLVDAGSLPLVLNFANAVEPGGGFLSGAVAQEEYLARSSCLYATIRNNRMYSYHWEMGSESFFASGWAILSPDVPVFRADKGTLLPTPWTCAMLTCAAPVARKIGLERATEAMEVRVGRVLAVARAYGYRSLVLGAWGCGAFHNDPTAVAGFFRDALTGEFFGAFDEAIFAITDWSQERRYLGPFRDAFAEIG